MMTVAPRVKVKDLLTTRRSRAEFHIARGTFRRDWFCVRLNTIALRLNIPSMSFVSFNTLQNPSSNVLTIKPQQPPPVVDLDVLQAASRVLQEQLLKDAQIIPDHGEMFAYSAYLCLRLVRTSFSYAKQPEVLASTAFSRMIIEYHSSRENWREFQRVYSSISLVRGCSAPSALVS